MTTADLYRQLADSAERIADLEQQNLALLQQVREMESAKVACEPRQWLTVKEAAELLGIKLLDHVVVTDTDCSSMRAKGELT